MRLSPHCSFNADLGLPVEIRVPTPSRPVASALAPQADSTRLGISASVASAGPVRLPGGSDPES